ncbi:uncharacterized protein LOC132255707 [Phlebotomus argentipes]|uniref:uncharacterized protein LOC132255707 n=1 Tax=Phlebotomus argentipes TaxID=94469 RepID=UPI002893022F|nr:uncharacterized protein LOC132255707 [Phlebotomus argentipes]
MGFLRLSECCRTVLRVEQDFLEDFSFRDVAREMERVFSAEECRSILAEATEESRTEKMLFLLMYKRPQALRLFQEVLLKDYDWLSERITESGVTNERFWAYEKCIRESNIPNNRSGVIYRTDLLWQARKVLESLKECNYLVIHGNTGSGKRWLAIDACCDHRVISAMNYRIFWLSVTDCVKPEKILSKMECLKAMLRDALDKEVLLLERKNGYISVEAKMEAERSDLRQMMRHESLRDCLLVLNDLQNEMTQAAFDLHCKILVTTRNRCSMARVNEQKKTLLSTNGGLTESECFCLFEHALAQPVQQNHLRGYINQIHRVINGSPDLVAKIAKNLLGVFDGNVERRLREWLACLREGVENNRTKSVMEESLKVLDNEQAELYRRLAIFPPNCLIPIPVLAQYYHLSTMQVEELVRKLEKFSLLEIDYVQMANGESQMMCRIHFICAQYLMRSTKRNHLVEFHRQFTAKYEIQRVLEARTEPNVLKFPNDHYFYTFIGYHLIHGELFDTFVQLFSDFGFLEVKIRESGLTNTIGDLRMYQELGSPVVFPFFEHLQYFLPNIEARIYQSRDLTLLQQALGGSFAIASEARQQLMQFPDKLWFRMNCIAKWRRIVQLCANPSILRFLTPTSVLVAQKDHNIVHADLSNNYKSVPNVFSGHEMEIIEMEVFARSYLISLDASGVMYCWYVGRDCGRRTNRRQFAGHANYSIHDAYKFDPLQKIHVQKLVCFHTFFDGQSQKLLCALATGQIITYNWRDGQFVMSPSENFFTHCQNIKCLQYIGGKKLLVLDSEGKIRCFNLQNHAEVGFTKRPWDDNETTAIAIHFNARKKLIYYIFPRKIRQIKIKSSNYPFLRVNFIREIYTTETTIECSALARNGRFLVLGTKMGIIVFDCARRVEVVQNCVTERVACIDVFTSKEIIVIYGNDSTKNIANIFEINVQSQSATRLQPHLSEIIVQHDDNNPPTLLAVDTAKHLHEYNISDAKDIVKVTEKHCYQFSNITATANSEHKTIIFLGCDDGRICQYSSNGNCVELDNLGASIDFLKSINAVLIVGTSVTFRLLNKEPHDGGIRNCHALDEEHIVVITKGMNVKILNMNSNIVISSFNCNSDSKLAFCDYVHPYLMTCSKQQSMIIYRVEMNGEIVSFAKLKNLAKRIDSNASSIAISAQKEFLAVGFLSGSINMYDIGGNFKLLQTLRSHQSAVTQLVFSPWCEANRPQILISLGEQICFWSVDFIVNNVVVNKGSVVSQLAERTRRLSLSGDGESAWEGRMGASEKPELLSCVKFAGNCATKLHYDKNFTRFLAIDDEGEIYVLILNDCHNFR